jgi:hypothetical protein
VRFLQVCKSDAIKHLQLVILESSPMPSDPAASQTPGTTPDGDKPPGYQPSAGRKLFMLGLCIAGLIFVWTYYYFATHPH